MTTPKKSWYLQKSTLRVIWASLLIAGFLLMVLSVVLGIIAMTNLVPGATPDISVLLVVIISAIVVLVLSMVANQMSRP